jgi:uncharacterized protein
VKASALALSILLTASGCSAQVDDAEQSQEPIHPIADLPDRPRGPVLDQADILPAVEEARLDQRLRELQKRTGNALVVVSVQSLGGESIENYAYNLFNTWGIGNASTHRGLLLLIAPAERKVRIEVGCGLETTISDVTAGRVIRDEITPVYANGDLVGGTLAGVDALVKRLTTPIPANDAGSRSAVCRRQLEEAA